MQFSKIVGHKNLINNIIAAFAENRVAHTQLFLGEEGRGALPIAIAYAQYLLCSNKTDSDSCGVCPSCKKFVKLAHPDLHFYFPTATNSEVKKDPKSSLVMDTWRSYLLDNDSYITLNGWLNELGVGNKQGFIRKDDANEIIGKVSLKAYEGRYKIFIIWMVDKMNDAASNKLLKTFEEPPENTILLLIAKSYEQLLATIRSRAQLVKVSKISDVDIKNKMLSSGYDVVNIDEIVKIANGNWITAMDLVDNSGESEENFDYFRTWLRLCYQPKDYADLYKFNNQMSKLGREKQKSLLSFGLKVIHNSILNNNNNSDKVKAAGEELEFTKKFSKFINRANQQQMYNLFNDAIYHIERNAHAGILFSDLSFKIVDLISVGKTYASKN